MTTTQISVHTCDRCGITSEIRESHQEYEWGIMFARHVNGPLRIGSDKRGADMCPTCTSNLKYWWSLGKDAST